MEETTQVIASGLYPEGHSSGRVAISSINRTVPYFPRKHQRTSSTPVASRHPDRRLCRHSFSCHNLSGHAFRSEARNHAFNKYKAL